MEWAKPTVAEEGGQQLIPARWLHLYYYEALNILFRVENSLRVFVYAVLKNELFDKWSQLHITSEDSQEGTIESIAKRRRVQAGRFGYLGYSIYCPIMHLTTGELINIIISDTYWKYFSRFFPGSKEIIKNKLEEIGVIRNALAHFRPLKADDVEVAKQNAKQALMHIEKFLSQMLHCNTIVPTNTTDDWYKELNTLGNEFCALKFNQSKDEQWVRLSFLYKPITLRRIGETYLTFSMINLITPAFLKISPALSKLVTCLFESVYGSLDDTKTPDITKSISFVFRKTLLEKEYSTVKTAFEAFLQQIASEVELIKQDNLAKGELAESVSLSAYKPNANSERWFVET
jgi:hypothetical protein